METHLRLARCRVDMFGHVMSGYVRPHVWQHRHVTFGCVTRVPHFSLVAFSFPFSLPAAEACGFSSPSPSIFPFFPSLSPLLQIQLTNSRILSYWLIAGIRRILLDFVVFAFMRRDFALGFVPLRVVCLLPELLSGFFFFPALLAL
ncbi:hypothetical protein ACLOJK_018045 [Asimina triloba]